MWKLNNPKLKEIIPIYNLLNHPLVGSKLKYNNYEFTVNCVLKEWKSGWFISVELESELTQDQYIRIPYENINSEDSEIIEKIQIIKNQMEIE